MVSVSFFALSKPGPHPFFSQTRPLLYRCRWSRPWWRSSGSLTRQSTWPTWRCCATSHCLPLPLVNISGGNAVNDPQESTIDPPPLTIRASNWANRFTDPFGTGWKCLPPFLWRLRLKTGALGGVILPVASQPGKPPIRWNWIQLNGAIHVQTFS